MKKLLLSGFAVIGAATAAAGYKPLRNYYNGPMVDPKIMEHANLKDNVIVITGVSKNGIGYETCKSLLAKNGTIIIGVRDLKKGEATRREILEQVALEENNQNNSKGNIYVMQLDLNDLDSVKHFADEIKEKFKRCDILINNAGISNVPHALSKQNVEIHFGTNHLGHFLLTNLLIDQLKDSKGRVITVASRAHENYYGKTFKLDEVYNNTCHYVPSHYLYARSKFANVLFSKKLDRILAEQSKDELDRCTSYSLHPGLVTSSIGRYSSLMSFVIGTVGRIFGKDLVHGSQTTLHVALADKSQLRGGAYYADCKEKQTNPLANEISIQDELWQTSKVLCAKYLRETD
ncbi:predicted protein [Naegleria gruberi]|uniref:Predicted protein n=1 Tax=Naegleria gruberi TaxID=5762 RepID=D2W2H3_NAEGR|nr:uncharacterized protein NAEGRDRAFT_75588 [Naegleria gruberi]EFC36712.1 predicted protein [Naegleria gruberi]|eukprot:XP_002669456.1 predicted protein [Naegleria gruberi strain NEG-M]